MSNIKQKKVEILKLCGDRCKVYIQPRETPKKEKGKLKK